MKNIYDRLSDSLSDSSQRTEDFEEVRMFFITWCSDYNFHPEVLIALLEDEVKLQDVEDFTSLLSKTA